MNESMKNNIYMDTVFDLYRKNKETGEIAKINYDDITSMFVGGFTFIINDNDIPFDFEASNVSEGDCKNFEYESGRGLVFNEYTLDPCFEDTYEELGLDWDDLTAEFLGSVSNIDEFVINYTLSDKWKEENKEVVIPKHQLEEYQIVDNREYEDDSNFCMYAVLKKITFTDDDDNEYMVSQDVIDEFNFRAK